MATPGLGGGTWKSRHSRKVREVYRPHGRHPNHYLPHTYKRLFDDGSLDLNYFYTIFSLSDYFHKYTVQVKCESDPGDTAFELRGFSFLFLFQHISKRTQTHCELMARSGKSQPVLQHMNN